MKRSFIEGLKTKVYIILFLTIIALPLFQSYTSIFNDNLLNEKRSTPTKPVYKKDEPISKYLSEYENYFNDTFGFRDYFIRLANYVDVNIFDKSPNTSVLLGKNDYLYSSEELNDYNKIATLTPEEIDTIVKNLFYLQTALNERGIQFIFAIAPNKSTIYPEYMLEPSINPNGTSTLDNFQKALKQYGVNYIDYKSLMLDNKDKYELYYKRDTHWNTIASALAAKELMNILSEDYNINDYSINISNFREEFRQGDLDDLLGLKSPVLEETCDVDITLPTIKFPKTLAYHDSFYNEVLPLLDGFFIQRMDMHNFNAPMHSNLKEFDENAKVVVFEVVERFLYKLKDYELGLFDDDFSILEDYLSYELPLDITDDNIEFKDVVQYSYNDYYSYSFLTKESSITWDVPNKKFDYLLLEFENVPKHLSLAISYADSNGEFKEKQRASFMLQPDKTKYLIKIKNPIDINKLKLTVNNKTNVDINIKDIKIMSSK